MATPLVLGPMLRYVDETSASICVETRADCSVSVHAEGRSWRAHSFAVHGHHYALFEVDRLKPGSVSPYSVEIDGVSVWPEPDSEYPRVSSTAIAAGPPEWAAASSPTGCSACRKPPSARR